MLGRILLGVALAPLLLKATENKPAHNGCTSATEKVSPKQVNALADKTEPMQTGLVIGSAIDSVRRWKFRSYLVNGLKKSFCGKATLRYKANDAEVKHEVVQSA